MGERGDALIVCAHLVHPFAGVVANDEQAGEVLEPRDEQHKRLKTRAEEYFFKPLDVAKLLTTAQGYIPIGGEGVPADDTAGAGLIEVSDDLIIAEDEDVDIIEVDEPVQDSEPTLVVGQNTVQPAKLTDATEAEIDSAIGELSGALGEDNALEPAASAESGAAARVSRLSGSMPAVVPASQQAEVERLTALLRERDEQFAALRTTSGTSEREFLALRNELNQKERELLEIKDQLFAKDSTILELRERSGELDARVSTQSQELSGLRTRVAAAEQSAQELNAQLDASRNELQSASVRLSDFERRASQLTKTNEAAADQISALQTQSQEAQDQLVSEKAQAEATQGQLSERLEAAKREADAVQTGLAAEVEGLRGQLSESEQRVDSEARDRDRGFHRPT